jgi:murein L,D-transpeptidase YafK
MNKLDVNILRLLFSVMLLISGVNSYALDKADSVFVDKSESRLYLMRDGVAFRDYHVAFGANPKGHKQEEGDERTPEGEYTLDYKKEDSAFYKAIHISYPNENDTRRAETRGVNPGGFIMIHGQKNGLGWLSIISQRFNWTNGCIAVKNSEMDEIWQSVDAGTPIEIVD